MKFRRWKVQLSILGSFLFFMLFIYYGFKRDVFANNGSPMVIGNFRLSSTSFTQLPLTGKLSVFNVGMTSSDKEKLLLTLSVLESAMKRANVTYLLYGGSLLGALRHGGIIPWDDDVDIMINDSHVHKFTEEVNKLHDYKFYNPKDSQWKFYSVLGKPVPNTTYMWPYIDIYRFKENQTHIYDSLNQYQVLFSYMKSDVFPLTKCNFERFYLNVPRFTEKIVTSNYDPDYCVSAKFDHKKDIPIRSQRHVVPCKQLNQYYKFGSFCKSEKK